MTDLQNDVRSLLVTMGLADKDTPIPTARRGQDQAAEDAARKKKKEAKKAKKKKKQEKREREKKKKEKAEAKQAKQAEQQKKKKRKRSDDSAGGTSSKKARSQGDGEGEGEDDEGDLTMAAPQEEEEEAEVDPVAMELWHQNRWAQPLQTQDGKKKKHKKKHKKDVVVKKAPSEHLVASTRARAEHKLAELMESDLVQNNPYASRSRDDRFMDSVLKSGTLSDRVAAMTLRVEENPMMNMETLRQLVTMAKSKGRREARLAAEALRELFASALLPQDRKLRALHEQPLDRAVGGRDELVLYWLLEDQIKQLYAEYREALVQMSMDTMGYIKKDAVKAMFFLLERCPEGERELLASAVNKLGDPDRPLASKVVYLLTQLVQRHQGMKTAVVKEVERLVLRPNLPERGKYYCVVFLNQIMLSQDEVRLANRLITIYLALFRVHSTDMRSKMLSALLTGVTRAFPYAEMDDESYADQLDTLFRISHQGTFVNRLRAFMLLYQVMLKSEAVTDRFYRSLYELLLSKDIPQTGRLAMFFNLLYKSIKNDPVQHRAAAFAKRLVQIASHQQPQFTCGALILLSEIVKANAEVKRLILAPPAQTATEPYDGRKREPKFANADASCLWELTLLARHFHPSVSKFAATLLSGGVITYNSDPLQDFTTMSFLDRFVYRNPKKLNALEQAVRRGIPAMQHVGGKRRGPQPNTKSFTEMRANRVPESDAFMYKFFKRKEEQEKEKEVVPVDVRPNETLEAVADRIIEDEIAKYGDVDGDADLDGFSDVDFGEDDDDDEDMEFEMIEGADEDGEEVDFAAMDGIVPVASLEGPTLADMMDADEDGDALDDDGDTQMTAASSRAARQEDEEEQRKSVFASSEEFAHLLEMGPQPIMGKQEQKWLDKKTRSHGGTKKKHGGKSKKKKSKKKKR